YLTQENVCELLLAARHKSRAEIEEALAERFPRRDVSSVAAKQSDISEEFKSGEIIQLAPGPVELFELEQINPGLPATTMPPARRVLARFSSPPARRAKVPGVHQLARTRLPRRVWHSRSRSIARRMTCCAAPRRFWATRCPRAMLPKSCVWRSAGWSRSSSN